MVKNAWRAITRGIWMNMVHGRIIILGGPTASGKSALAMEMAHRLDAVIINADSQQVYREIPIITAQPTKAEQEAIEHRLYGIISVRDFFSVALWLEMVEKEIKTVLAQGKLPLLVGGTGMYIKSLVEGIAVVPEISTAIRTTLRQQCDVEGTEAIHKMLAEKDPEMASKLKPADRQRVLRAYEVLLETGKSLRYWHNQKTTPVFSPDIIKMFFLMPDRNAVYEKCNLRFVQMVEDGVLDEMRELDKMQVPATLPAMRAHGLRELIAYLHGDILLEDAISISQQHTRNYVKRQFTWFRHQMPGVQVIENGDNIFSKL